MNFELFRQELSGAFNRSPAMEAVASAKPFEQELVDDGRRPPAHPTFDGGIYEKEEELACALLVASELKKNVILWTETNTDEADVSHALTLFAQTWAEELGLTHLAWESTGSEARERVSKQPDDYILSFRLSSTELRKHGVISAARDPSDSPLSQFLRLPSMRGVLIFTELHQATSDLQQLFPALLDRKPFLSGAGVPPGILIVLTGRWDCDPKFIGPNIVSRAARMFWRGSAQGTPS